MNNKGQVILYALMFGVMVIILGMAIAPAIIQSSSEARTSMDCSNPAISNYMKGSCLIVDITSPYFVLGVIFIGFAILSAKFIFEVI